MANTINIYSVIIPTYNAEGYVGKCIDHVRRFFPEAEIVVSDGGSCDRTLEVIGKLNVTVVLSARGRGVQLNEGARQAKGQVLFFLHADTLITPGVAQSIRERFLDVRFRVAKLRLSFDRKDWLLSLYARLARFDSIWTSFGDQGIVIRKDFFQELGGFPDWPLLEDVSLFQKARKRSRVYILPADVITSAQRFVKNGLLRQQLFNAGIICKYLRGVSPAQLAAEYDNFGRKK